MVMYCEVCGKKTERSFLTRIEGAVLVTCESCAERGEIIQEYRAGTRAKIRQTYTDIVEDFGRKVREARKSLKMDLRQLSRETGISVRTLKLIEEERIIPTEEQAKKLEKALGIELVEREEFEPEGRGDFQPTLGDVVRIR